MRGSLTRPHRTDTARLFVGGHPAFGHGRHQRFLVLLTALLGCLAVNVWLYHGHAARCCADARVALGCSADNDAESCRGFPGSCGELRASHFSFASAALASSSAATGHASGPHSCPAFPDPASGGHTFAAGLIAVAVSLACVQLAVSCFTLSTAPDEAQPCLARRSGWCSGAWWADGALSRLERLAERCLRACRRPARSRDARSAALRGVGYALLLLCWLFFVWTTLLYGAEVYDLGGDATSVAFQRAWGVAVGIAQAWQARHVARAALASLTLRGTAWLEHAADVASARATLLHGGTAWAAACTFVRFRRAVA